MQRFNWFHINKIAFISGHLDVDALDFKTHYIPKINEAIAKGHYFVVGDAKGADALAQNYLYHNYHHLYVKVYHMLDKPRFNEGSFAAIGGFENDDDRDSAMTGASDYDIAWIRPGKENSGTAKNINRRFENKIRGFSTLEKGWDSYDADPASQLAVKNALSLYANAATLAYKVTPTIVGGIAMYYAKKMIFIELYNDGTNCVIWNYGRIDENVELDINCSLTLDELIAELNEKLDNETNNTKPI